jgi:hypothetical protein
MSKDLIKEFLDKFSSAENCDSENSSACDILGDLNIDIDKLDLRFNKNKEKVAQNLQNLKEDDCNFCDTTDYLFSDLADIWKKNKLYWDIGKKP